MHPKQADNHPSKDLLSAYTAGRLANNEIVTIKRHLVSCRGCSDTVEEIRGKTSVYPAGNVPAKINAEADTARLKPRPKQDKLRLICGHCRKPVIVKAMYAGKKCKCPHCTRLLMIPAPSQLAATLPPRAATREDETIDSGVRLQSGTNRSVADPSLVDQSRYKIDELLGSGGMGAVFKAEHRLMQRTVALKIINQDLVANKSMVDRFRREVRAAARLDHINIVRAHDAEQAGKAHFLVMEYVKGTELADVVAQRGPLPVAEACKYIHQAALGLQHANENGMVHRDIKPQNLMLTANGVVKILDFGLASLNKESVSPEEMAGAIAGGSLPGDLTQTGSIMGTPDYMAPEQGHDAHSADIRSDIYSLGCTFYFLLTGNAPFPDGKTMDKLMCHMVRQPKPVTQFRKDVPADLARVLDKMMAKDPANRHQTPAQLAAALAPYVEGKKELSLLKTLDKQPIFWAAAGVLCVFALLLFTISFVLGLAVTVLGFGALAVRTIAGKGWPATAAKKYPSPATVQQHLLRRYPLFGTLAAATAVLFFGSILSITIGIYNLVFAGEANNGKVAAIEKPQPPRPKKKIAPVPVIEQPQLLAPLEKAVLDNGQKDGKDGVTWIFTWTPVKGAQEYELHVSGEADVYPEVCERTKELFVQYTPPNGYISSGNLNGWQWKVRAIRDGNPLPWSVTRSFDVKPAHSAPVDVKTAPPLDAEAWVNGAGYSAQDLKGKVVLLDFFAMWCPPCIRTIPHLREWHEKYSKSGLAIVGVTRYYGYDWDEQTRRAKRVSGLTDEQEQAAMKRFAKQFRLKQRIAITRRGSDFYEKHKVNGIPQMVVIDQKGNIQLVRTGSGQRNANDVEETIRKLLGLSALKKQTSSVQPITGNMVSGTLSANDPIDSFAFTRNSYHKVHSIQLLAGKSYQIDLQSDYDPYLRLEDSNRKPLLYNDDVLSPTNLNSRLLFAPKTTATYRLIVTSFRPGATGAYSVNVREVQKSGSPTIETHNLAATAKDVKSSKGKLYAYHRMDFKGGRPYTIEVEGIGFDSYLYLYDHESKSLIAQNDDIVPGNTQRSRLDFTPQVDRSYDVIVSSFGIGATGNYTLTVQSYEPAGKK